MKDFVNKSFRNENKRNHKKQKNAIIDGLVDFIRLMVLCVLFVARLYMGCASILSYYAHAVYGVRIHERFFLIFSLWFIIIRIPLRHKISGG